MASHFTHVVGALSKDPTMKYLESGAAVCNFSIPVTERWGQGDNQQERTTWYNVTVWQKLAENCNTYLRKGSVVSVQGTVSARAYMSNGEPTASLDLRAARISFEANWGNDSSSGGQRAQGASAPRQQAPPPAPPTTIDDIPF